MVEPTGEECSKESANQPKLEMGPDEIKGAEHGTHNHQCDSELAHESLQTAGDARPQYELN